MAWACLRLRCATPGREERPSAQSTRLKQEDEPSLCLDADTVKFVPYKRAVDIEAGLLWQ